MKELVFGGQSLIIGRGSLLSIKNIKAAKAFIVTGGSSMIASGVTAKIETLLRGNSCETYTHSGITKNPDTRAVLDGVAKMREFGPDLLLAVGSTRVNPVNITPERMTDLLKRMFEGG